MRRYRIVSQIACLIVFGILFIHVTRAPLGYRLPAPLFLRLNPLPALLASTASRSLELPMLWLAAFVAAVTLVLGRVFCGYVCPLGTIIDGADRYLFTRMRAASRRPPRYLQRVKYVILIALLTLAALGVLFTLFMDPISLLTRIGAIIAHPLGLLLAEDAARTLSAAGVERMRTVTFYSRYFYTGAVTLALVLVVLAGGIWDRRFWCQYVCPSGALLGIIGRYAPWRRRVVNAGCNECKRCARMCPTRAIDEASVARTAVSECIVCGACTRPRESCSGFGFGSLSGRETSGADIERRHVIGGLLVGGMALPLFQADAVIRHSAYGSVIRPPGALPERQFLARCIACGACMKACPTNALQPCTLADGVSRIYTPRLVPRQGGCEEKCHLCGWVCPTGAIRKLTLEQKRVAKIGTAVIARQRCLAWTQNKECLVCDEVCPYKAIEVRVEQTSRGVFKVPLVAEDYCMGCGWCETHCPIHDPAAIVVSRFGENRLASGEYVSEMQRRRIEAWQHSSDAHLGITAPVDRTEAVTPGSGEAAQRDYGHDGAAGSTLPPGFIE